MNYWMIKLYYQGSILEWVQPFKLVIKNILKEKLKEKKLNQFLLNFFGIKFFDGILNNFLLLFIFKCFFKCFFINRGLGTSFLLFLFNFIFFKNHKLKFLVRKQLFYCIFLNILYIRDLQSNCLFTIKFLHINFVFFSFFLSEKIKKCFCAHLNLRFYF